MDRKNENRKQKTENKKKANAHHIILKNKRPESIK